jgi:hypothetical protein
MPTKVAYLANRATRYEVALEHEGRQWLVGYTIRRSRQGLLAKMREQGQAILRITAMPEDARVTSPNPETLAFSNGSVIRFTHRTQRDAVLSGELPFVGKE